MRKLFSRHFLSLILAVLALICGEDALLSETCPSEFGYNALCLD